MKGTTKWGAGILEYDNAGGAGGRRGGTGERRTGWRKGIKKRLEKERKGKELGDEEEVRQGNRNMGKDEGRK